jgi:hypothetical protein
MESRHIGNRDEYLAEFSEKIRPEAIKNVLDIRKFEIDLYWKRATYFWTFIGATIAGYLALLNTSNSDPQRQLSQFILVVLGVLFSLCWYFVNRGSKFWQLNWEKHLDAMEDEVIGPLYKTTISKDYYRRRLYVINGPYPFSVSKINILLSFFVFVLWLLIYFHFLYTNSSLFVGQGCVKVTFYNVLNIVLWASVIILVFFGRTGKPFNDPYITHISFDKRGFSEDRPVKKDDSQPVDSANRP